MQHTPESAERPLADADDLQPSKRHKTGSAGDESAEQDAQPKAFRAMQIPVLPALISATSVAAYRNQIECKMTFPVRLKAEGATEEEVEQYPAAPTLLGGRQCSKWVSAMTGPTSSIAKGIPPEGVMMTAMEGVQQNTLFEVIAALHTGELPCCEGNIVDYLTIADYLQVDALIEPIYTYISEDLLSQNPRLAFQLASRQQELSRTVDGKSLEAFLPIGFCKKLFANDQPDPSKQSSSDLWKDMTEVMFSPGLSPKQVFDVMHPAYISASQMMYVLLKFIRSDQASVEDKTSKDIVERCLKALRDWTFAPEAEILHGHLATQNFTDLSPSLKDIAIRIYNTLTPKRNPEEQDIIIPLDKTGTEGRTWKRCTNAGFGCQFTTFLNYKWRIDQAGDQRLGNGDLEMQLKVESEPSEEHRSAPQKKCSIIVGCLRRPDLWDKHPILFITSKATDYGAEYKSVRFRGLLKKLQGDDSFHHNSETCGDGSGFLNLFAGLLF